MGSLLSLTFAERQILQDLMAHELKQPPVPSLDSYSGSYQPLEHAQYSSSSSGEEEMEEEGERRGETAAVSWMGASGGGGGFDDVEEMEEMESSEDEGYTVRVRESTKMEGGGKG